MGSGLFCGILALPVWGRARCPIICATTVNKKHELVLVCHPRRDALGIVIFPIREASCQRSSYYGGGVWFCILLCRNDNHILFLSRGATGTLFSDAGNLVIFGR